jgi:phage gp45-like
MKAFNRNFGVDLQEGEVALYDNKGNKIILKSDDSIEIIAVSQVNINSPNVAVSNNLTVLNNVTINGNLEVMGNITYHGQLINAGT